MRIGILICGKPTKKFINKFGNCGKIYKDFLSSIENNFRYQYYNCYEGTFPDKFDCGSKYNDKGVARRLTLTTFVKI